jgi:small subunit ribosomal protein S6
MTRTYELCFIVEPRVSDDDAQKICDKYTKLIEDGGGEITYVDHWGKRKLAYPINNFNEGRYYVVYVSIDGAMSWTAIERLLMQDEAVLRHLVVRTDEDLKRAARKGKVQPPVPGGEPEQKSEKKSAESRSS